MNKLALILFPAVLLLIGAHQGLEPLKSAFGTIAPAVKFRLPQSSSSNDEASTELLAPSPTQEIEEVTTKLKLAPSPPPAAKAAAAKNSSPYDMIVGCSHHKTGTFQLRCLMKNFANTAKLNEPIRICFKDNSVTHVHMEACRNNFENNASQPAKKPIMFKTFHGLKQRCRSLDDDDEWEPCLSFMTGKVCNVIMVKSMQRPGKCSIQLPEDANLAFFNIIRNPIDAVLSAYSFHSERPKSEPWLFRPKNLTDLSQRLRWAGAEPETLRLMGLGRNRKEEHKSYADLLTSLPPEKGVLLEFWHSLPEVLSIARQYTILTGLPGTVHARFEGLRDDFNSTVLAALEHYQLNSEPKEMLDAAVADGCDPGTWTEAQIEKSNHVTIGKKEGVKEAAEAALLKYPTAKRILCELCAELAYQDSRCDLDSNDVER